MPIQIVNSGVIAQPHNTTSTVVFRNEGGVVCRLSNNLSGHRKSKHPSHRGSIDGLDGGTVLPASDRHATLAVAHPCDGEGGNSSSPYDMTSVFGLKVREEAGVKYYMLHI